MFARCCRQILLFLCLSAACPSFAGPHADFDEANRFYEQGKYSEAIARYQAVLKSGVSPSLLYNLGNAYFKNGEIGRAIYHYRRARALAPRDPDVQANLRFARDRVNGGASLTNGPLDRVATYFTPNELAVTTALLLWAFLALLIAGRVRPALRSSLRLYIAALGAFLALATLALLLAYRAAQEPVAIAVRQLPLHLGPLTESQASFTVADGTELRVENEREGWLQLADRSGRTGWVEAKEVLRLP